MQTVHKRIERSNELRTEMNTGISIKICGMRHPENLREVLGADPDYLGFIEYATSPRYVGEDFTMPPIPASVRKVGVFVNETESTILQKAKKQGYDLIQLHGSESVELCLKLKDKGLEVIKVFSIDDRFDFQATKAYTPIADFFLFDTKGKLHGGNARQFDWNILKHYDQEVPFFLSGGLSIDNIGAITDLKHMNLHAVDVNSGVEVSPGIKSISKVLQLVDLVRKNDLTNG